MAAILESITGSILEKGDFLFYISDLFSGINYPPYQNYFDDLISMEFVRKRNLVLACGILVMICTAVNWVSLIPVLLPLPLLILIWPSAVYSSISCSLQCDMNWSLAEMGIQRLESREVC